MKKQILFFLLFAALLCVSHFFINTSLPIKYAISKTMVGYIYILLFIVTGGGTLALYLVNDIDVNRVGQTFLGLTVFKMLVVLTFILIQVKGFDNPPKLAYHLLISYLLFLVYICLIAFKIINSNNYVKKEE